MKDYIHCIHGLIWMTCSSCKDKGEDGVQAELARQNEEQKSKLIFDYQEASEASLNEAGDFAYDTDDMGM